MPVERPTIGGTIVEAEAFEALGDIPQNRVLLAEKLTSNPSIKPEVVEGLTSIEQVFEYFHPKIEIGFETEVGSVCKETLSFNNLGDFGIDGITAQSAMLRDLNSKKHEYQEIIRQLKSNKLLKQALTQQEMKIAFLNVLQALIMEMEATVV